MKVLAIDTSNQTLAVAICDGKRVIGQYVSTLKRNHSLSLMPIIDFLVADNQLTPKDLDRIVVAEGPGSYTGLRIGVTTAKTLAWTLGIDLVGVSSLASVAANITDFKGLIVPIFDARRQNVYSASYKWQEGKLVSVLPDQHVPLDFWLEKLKEYQEEIRFVGEDVIKFQELILEQFPEMQLNDNPMQNTLNAVSLAQLGLENEPVTNLDDFVPTYLKRVEAEEKWLENHEEQRESYVKKV